MPLTVTHSKTLASPDSGTEDKVYGSDYVASGSHTVNESNVAITGGSITGATGNVYTLTALTIAANPTDAQTIFFGASAAAPNTTAVVNVCPVPIAGTAIRIDLEVGVAGTLGTTEQATVSFRLNDTTDTTISAAVQFNARRQTYAATVTITVAAGDYFQIKCVNPTWVTNPTGVSMAAIVTVRP